REPRPVAAVPERVDDPGREQAALVQILVDERVREGGVEPLGEGEHDGDRRDDDDDHLEPETPAHRVPLGRSTGRRPGRFTAAGGGGGPAAREGLREGCYSADFPRLLKRAFPSPVPIVRTPHRVTSCMNGSSLRPCTTASLCIRTAVGWSPIDGIASRMECGRLKRLLSQFPGRFWAPRSIAPLWSILPGQPIPTNGASSSPSFPARRTSDFSISTRRSTASSRLGFSSP